MVRHPADPVLRTAAAAALFLWETQGRWTERSALNETSVISISRHMKRARDHTFSWRKNTFMSQQPFFLRGSGSAFAALAAFVTTLCCVGFPALVGFLSALGAGFLLNDRYLEPLLAATLLLTLLIVVLHRCRHHQTGPFNLSLDASATPVFAVS